MVSTGNTWDHDHYLGPTQEKKMKRFHFLSLTSKASETKYTQIRI